MKTTTQTTASLTAIPEPFASRLRELAPSVSFTVSREIDLHDRWDGDGPDPRDDGFDAYDVDVTASAIVGGELIEGSASLGSSYFRPDEPTGELHGYLPQMLDEAAEELQQVLAWKGDPLAHAAELNGARAWLKAEMHRRYEEHMNERKGNA